jgi:hypothetical protein
VAKINIDNIKTEKELQIALRELDRRWATANSIKDSRKRSKEILKLKAEVNQMMIAFKRLNGSANLKDTNGRSLCKKMFKTIASWFSIINKKYKDV